MKERLFKETTVWFEKSEKELIRYRLSQKLSDKKYFVKSADQLYEKFDEKTNNQQNAYHIDSLFENGISEFAQESFDTIEEAIAAFNAESLK